MSDNITESSGFKILNGASATCALIVVLVVLFLKKYRPECVDRTTINLQTAIALVDIPRHLITLNLYTEDETLCSLMAFGAVFTAHINVLLSVAIALNLQMIYLHECFPRRRWQILLFLVPTGLSLVLDLIPFATGDYGLDDRGSCYLVDSSPYRKLYGYLLYYCTCIPGYIYCLFVFISVAIKLVITNPNSGHTNEQTPLLIPQSMESRHLALRISFYPLACFLCHSGGVVLGIQDALSIEAPSYMVTWCMIGISTTGLLNLIAFLLDPAFKEALSPKPISLNNPESQPTDTVGPQNAQSNQVLDPAAAALAAKERHNAYIREATAREIERQRSLPQTVW